MVRIRCLEMRHLDMREKLSPLSRCSCPIQTFLLGDHCSKCICSPGTPGQVGHNITRYSETLASVEVVLEGYLVSPMSVGSH